MYCIDCVENVATMLLMTCYLQVSSQQSLEGSIFLGLRGGWIVTNHNRDSAHWGRFSQKSIAYSKLLFELSRMPTQWSVQARRDTPALAINVNNCNNVFANLVSTGFISSVLGGIQLFGENQKWINFILESCQIIIISLTSGGQVFQSSASPGKVADAVR